MPKIHSFDVFDTVITRLVGEPKAAFLIMGRRLEAEGALGDVSAAEFARLRSASEWHEIERRGRHATLDEIHAELARRVPGLDPERAKSVEMDIERALLRAVPGAKERLAEARLESGRAVFASDMYLPPAFLESVLRDLGLFEDGDAVYVSAHVGAGKSDGAMFRMLMEEANAAAADCRHFGNCAHADVKAPMRVGWRAEHFPGGNRNRYEDALERHRDATGGLSSLLAGASRLARLDIGGLDERQSQIRTVAASVAGPLLAAYVLWVLRRAHDEGLQRLYFVARDGQSMLRIAQHLAPALGLGVELRYLHGSRQAWHLPSVEGELSKRDVERLLSARWTLTASDLASRLSLPDGLRQELSVRFAPSDRRLSQSEVEDAEAWLRRPDVAAAVLTSAARTRESLLAYLSQEGLLTGEPFGVVDLGWSGRMQESLARVLPDGARAMRGFFLMLHGQSHNPLGLTREAFLAQDSLGDSALVAPMAVMLEALCSADHGRTIGYAAAGGRMAPVLDEDSGSALFDWGLDIVHEGYQAFARHLAEVIASTDWRVDIGPATLDAFRLFLKNPTKAEAEAVGGFPFEESATNCQHVPLASALSPREAINAFVPGRPHPSSQRLWYQGALELSPPVVRSALRGWDVLRGSRKR